MIDSLLDGLSKPENKNMIAGYEKVINLVILPPEDPRMGCEEIAKKIAKKI